MTTYQLHDNISIM